MRSITCAFLFLLFAVQGFNGRKYEAENLKESFAPNGRNLLQGSPGLSKGVRFELPDGTEVTDIDIEDLEEDGFLHLAVGCESDEFLPESFTVIGKDSDSDNKNAFVVGLVVVIVFVLAIVSVCVCCWFCYKRSKSGEKMARRDPFPYKRSKSKEEIGQRECPCCKSPKSGEEAAQQDCPCCKSPKSRKKMAQQDCSCCKSPKSGEEAA